MNMLITKDIKLLVVHCSDTKDSENLAAIDLHKMHLKFGWDGVGYHKIINRSGKVENGRPDYWIGASAWVGISWSSSSDASAKDALLPWVISTNQHKQAAVQVTIVAPPKAN